MDCLSDRAGDTAFPPEAGFQSSGEWASRGYFEMKSRLTSFRYRRRKHMDPTAVANNFLSCTIEQSNIHKQQWLHPHINHWN